MVKLQQTKGGQNFITIPKAIVGFLRYQPHDEFSVELSGTGILLRPLR